MTAMGFVKEKELWGMGAVGFMYEISMVVALDKPVN